MKSVHATKSIHATKAKCKQMQENVMRSRDATKRVHAMKSVSKKSLKCSKKGRYIKKANPTKEKHNKKGRERKAERSATKA